MSETKTSEPIVRKITEEPAAKDPNVLILCEFKGMVKQITPLQTFLNPIKAEGESYEFNRFSVRPGVNMISRVNWEFLCNDTASYGGRYLIEKGNLFLIADGRNLVKDFLKGVQFINPFTIEALIDRAFNVNLLDEWFVYVTDHLSEPNYLEYSKQLDKRINALKNGIPVRTYNMDWSFPGQEVGGTLEDL